MPDRPPRLERVFQSYDPPIYFVTFNTHRRRNLLAKAEMHDRFAGFAHEAERRGIAVGRYVLMPDHMHLFVAGGPDFLLTQWVRMLKRTLSKSIPDAAPHWQQGFFDHIIRHTESYAEKWEYVRQNPVRAGLVSESESWPFQGEIVRIEARL
jgi:REP element-mobilizing transposase RayT